MCVLSGGLGPTHDDRTIEFLARALGRPLVVDHELEGEIERVSRSFAERMGRPYADFAAGVRKQASLPEGAVNLGLAGTAPGVLVEHDGRVAVALPGPPGELRRLWPAAASHPAFLRVVGTTRPRERRVMRFFGPSESAVARLLDERGGEVDGVEVTVCARDFEIHVDLFVERGAEDRGEKIEAALRSAFGRQLFAEDETPVEEMVLALCRARGLTLATAESCTGGMVGARLTAVPGASDVYVGGVVAYADATKVGALGVTGELLRAHGAVSAEVAEAMALGARQALGADLAVSVTGIAGPGGGSDEKPVGLVFLHVATPDGAHGRRIDFPGDRDRIRARATSFALHGLREALGDGTHG